ncbi:MAG: hypothetical protein ACFE9L_12395 [Candidatus Hodarchaeota archaeon]
MDAKTFLKADNKKKWSLITSHQIFQNLSNENLVNILIHERNMTNFTNLTRILANTREIQEKFNFIPFIRKIQDDSVSKEKKFSFLLIIIGVLYRRKDLDIRKQEKKELVNILREILNPILKAYAVLNDT